MSVRALQAELGQHPGHALMRFGQVGIDGERRLVMRFRAARVIVLTQHIGQIHPRDLVAGVVRDRLAVGGARRGAEPPRERESTQLVEREKIRRILPEHLEVSTLRALVVRLGPSARARSKVSRTCMAARLRQRVASRNQLEFPSLLVVH